MRAFTIALLALACLACSKANMHQTSSDLKAAASDIKNDPAVKSLGTDVKVAAKDAGSEIKKGAVAAKVELKKAGSDVKHTVDDDNKKS